MNRADNTVGILGCSARMALAAAALCMPVLSAQSPHVAAPGPAPHAAMPRGNGSQIPSAGANRSQTQPFSGQNPATRVAQNSVPRGAHLGQWMQQHSNLSPQQQQHALEREPGFSQLPQATQQRMVERLNRLNSMPEPQRERVLQRGEALERLNPQQRVQVRSAMGQLGALPEDRRRAVARTFRELRTMTPEQQNQLLGSPEYRQQFSDEERGTLGNLLSVSPLLPPSR